jgi:dolichol-phosphate mannosyltransferase
LKTQIEHGTVTRAALTGGGISLTTIAPLGAHYGMSQSAPTLSVVLPTLNEGLNIGPLIERLQKTTAALGLTSEILVVDGGSKDQTWQEAEKRGARCLLQRRPGYASALLEGLIATRGAYVLTLDSDLSHPPELLTQLWGAREEADIIVGSRFAPGGSSEAPAIRHLLSRILNSIFSVGLSIPVKDISSGYRLYKREALNLQDYHPENFSVLQELLIRAYAGGYSVKEIPLHYGERASGESHVSVLRFAVSYVPTFYRLWKLRNSLSTADYEYRSFSSRHPLQRYWIRKRVALIRELLGEPKRVLDIGSGSSRLATTVPGLVAIDSEPQKVRFLTNRGVHARVADAEHLPFPESSFDYVVLSEVLPYVSNVERAITEAHRVLSKNGIAIVCVPDSSCVAWRFFGALYRFLPNVRASQHEKPTTFSRSSIAKLFTDAGFRPLSYRYICSAELVIAFQKIG